MFTSSYRLLRWFYIGFDILIITSITLNPKSPFTSNSLLVISKYLEYRYNIGTIFPINNLPLLLLDDKTMVDSSSSSSSSSEKKLVQRNFEGNETLIKW